MQPCTYHQLRSNRNCFQILDQNSVESLKNSLDQIPHLQAKVREKVPLAIPTSWVCSVLCRSPQLKLEQPSTTSDPMNGKSHNLDYKVTSLGSKRMWKMTQERGQGPEWVVISKTFRFKLNVQNTRPGKQWKEKKCLQYWNTSQLP